MNMANYPLPQTTGESHKRWAGTQTLDFVPSESQQYLMDLVSEALNNNLFYNDEIFNYIEPKIRHLLPDDYNSRGTEVKHGVLGMEIYYARHVVEFKNQLEKETATRNNLDLVSGKLLGSVQFNNGVTLHKVIVADINDQNIIISGIRGNKRVSFMTSAVAIKNGIERWKTKASKKRF